MKQILLLVFLASSMTLFSQAKEHAGSYEFFSGNNDSYFLKDMLTLNPNGTFLFSSESYIEERMNKKRLQYGKGTWRSEKQLIFLKVEEADVDATHVLNLNNTKLRYDTKSPRDKSNRDIKTSARVIQSEIPWLKARILIKNANTKPVIKEKKCCKTKWEVYSFLIGKWIKKSEPNKQYHYSFEDEKGKFQVYDVNESGELIEANTEPTKIRIIKSENGFKIEYNYDKRLDMIYDIKLLNSKKLITVRKDGKESELHKIN